MTGYAEALVRLAHLVDRVFTDVGRDAGLTPQQAQLLCVLTDGPTGMGRLSELLHLERSSLSGLVDRVERRGLVERRRDGGDRRACLAGLTDPGSEVAHAVHGAVVRRLEELSVDVPAAQRAALVHAVGIVAAAEEGVPAGS